MTLRRHSNRQIGFECLENRNLLAGNILANFAAGSLGLTGDAAANGVQISQTSPGTWRVQGLGTTINGANSQTFGTNGLGGAPVVNIIGFFNAGNDIVQVLNGSLTGSLTIVTNAGADVVLIDGVTAKDITVATDDNPPLPQGNDVLTLMRSTATGGGGILLVTGDGSNVVTVNSVTSAESITLFTGAGTDSIAMSNSRSTTGSLTLAAGEGTNTVSLTNVAAPLAALIFGGDGRDTIAIANLSVPAGPITIAVQNGSNVVTVTNATAGTDFTVATGSGSDTIGLTNVRTGVGFDIFVAGGDGTNVITGNGLTSGRNLVVSTGINNDTIVLTRVNVAGSCAVGTQAGTDAVTLSSVAVTNTLAVDLGSGNNDQLTVALSSALTAIFDGGSGTGDILVRSRNTFGSQFFFGFEFVV